MSSFIIKDSNGHPISWSSRSMKFKTTNSNAFSLGFAFLVGGCGAALSVAIALRRSRWLSLQNIPLLEELCNIDGIDRALFTVLPTVDIAVSSSLDVELPGWLVDWFSDSRSTILPSSLGRTPDLQGFYSCYSRKTHVQSTINFSNTALGRLALVSTDLR